MRPSFKPSHLAPDGFVVDQFELFSDGYSGFIRPTKLIQIGDRLARGLDPSVDFATYVIKRQSGNMNIACTLAIGQIFVERNQASAAQVTDSHQGVLVADAPLLIGDLQKTLCRILVECSLKDLLVEGRCHHPPIKGQDCPSEEFLSHWKP